MKVFRQERSWFTAGLRVGFDEKKVSYAVDAAGFAEDAGTKIKLTRMIAITFDGLHQGSSLAGAPAARRF